MEEININKIEWKALEYNHKEHGPDWYWAIGLIALVVCGVLIWLKSYLFAIFIIIAGATLSLLHNIAITADSVRYYVGLLGKFPSNEKDSHVLRDLEISYWTEKYSAICSVMVRVVGQAEFEKKVSPEQLKSFKLVLGGGNGA